MLGILLIAFGAFHANKTYLTDPYLFTLNDKVNNLCVYFSMLIIPVYRLLWIKIKYTHPKEQSPSEGRWLDISQTLWHLDGLVQERRNSSALAMELRLSCTHPLICTLLSWTYQSHPGLFRWRIKCCDAGWNQECIYTMNVAAWLWQLCSVWWTLLWRRCHKVSHSSSLLKTARTGSFKS